MQLTYRGIRYSPTHLACETVVTEQDSYYRGARLRLREVIGLPSKKVLQTLVYRGVPYTIYLG
ncbi:MAG: DUF4278 domain-containing protein [Phormidesmis sp.]